MAAQEKYLVVEDPSGKVSVGVNHEVQIQTDCSNKQIDGAEDTEMGLGSSAEMGQEYISTMLRNSHLTVVARRVRGIVTMEPRGGGYKTYGIGAQICAFMLLMSSIVNVSVHKRVLDILYVIFACFTFMAIRYDVGCLSRCQLVLNASFSMSMIVPVALNHEWGVMTHQVGCVLLCFYCLLTKES